MRKQYTDKQKIAYYKRRAAMRSTRRPRRYVRGRGKYTLPGLSFSSKKFGGYLGGAAGAAIGNMIAPGIGGAVGAELGNYGGEQLGRIFKKITGVGDYTVKSNTLLYDSEVVPSFGEDSIRVRKREFVADINSVASVFTNQAFPINPGLSEVFPWLSAVARNYSQYRINGLIFQFVSTSSDAIASTTSLGLGQILLATNYNAAEDDFQDSPQMLNYMFSNSGKPSDNIMHAIECASPDQAQKLYYVRSGAVPSGQDPRLYDLGKFQIATNNMPATYEGMGQLWVSYDVTFCKSVQNNLLGYAVNTDLYQIATGISNSDPFGNNTGTEWTALTGSQIGTTINSDQIEFPPLLQSGFYRIDITWRGTGTSAWVPPTITLQNANFVNCWQSPQTSSSPSPISGQTASRVSISFVIKLGTDDTTTPVIVALSGATLPTTLTSCDLFITQVNGDLYDQFAES